MYQPVNNNFILWIWVLLLAKCLHAVKAVWMKCPKQKGLCRLLFSSTDLGGELTAIIIICFIPCCCPGSSCTGNGNHTHTRARGQQEWLNFLFSFTLLPADPCIGWLSAQNWKEICSHDSGYTAQCLNCSASRILGSQIPWCKSRRMPLIVMKYLHQHRSSKEMFSLFYLIIGVISFSSFQSRHVFCTRRHWSMMIPSKKGTQTT